MTVLDNNNIRKVGVAPCNNNKKS